MHALDNPIWHALNTHQRSMAQGSGSSLRYHPDAAPFAAVLEHSDEAMQQLHGLLSEHGAALVMSHGPWPCSPWLAAHPLGPVLQMVAPQVPAGPPERTMVELGPADLHDMLALVARTQPGPFGTRTLTMGRYIGVRDGGKLIAMAGERMRLDGFVEISAVCVDDNYRGRGLGGQLMAPLRQRILRDGNVPFLHVFEHNHAAVSLYRRLGFEVRDTFTLTRLEAR